MPNPTMLLFNHPIHGIVPIINRIPINSDNDEDHYEALVRRQTRNNKNYDAARNYDLFSLGSTVAVQQEDGGPVTHGTIVAIGSHHHSKRSYTV